MILASMPLFAAIRSPGVRMLCGEPTWPLITSSANPRLKQLKKLHTRRHRDKQGLVLLEGHRLVLDALSAGYTPEFVVVHDDALESHPEGQRLRTELEQLRDGSVVRAPPAVVADLSDTQTPQGILAVLPQPALPLPSAPTLVLVCDAVADPGNLGTLLRSAAGAGVGAALLTAGCSDAWAPKTLRAGMGAQFRLPVRSMDEWSAVSAQLASWGCTTFAADASGSEAHFDVDWRQPSALVVGSEAHGLSKHVRADPSVRLCRIPLGVGDLSQDDGGVSLESLNAAVAGSVILFEAQRQRLA
jgi:TrmH family RNA methyltransferase